jgi:hypothetical protein
VVHIARTHRALPASIKAAASVHGVPVEPTSAATNVSLRGSLGNGGRSQSRAELLQADRNQAVDGAGLDDLGVSGEERGERPVALLVLIEVSKMLLATSSTTP